ncbi:FeoA family protein [uncultured Roseivirga sp.]|uniref:FeoA family protein n=1 Tax=uncultured Roseivirga sp. TaxID=543088 RepID=UPI000D7969AB|nr:FeoA family protein [uncultured Roseivirga sp.]PWL29991.1 MAG: ferrous iron transport protein A [Roseivirga sp. XM-24bin3]
MKNITHLKLHEKAVIKGFTDEVLSVKLMEMGCLPGTEISLELIAPWGDPIAIEVAGYQLSLRKSEASSILIED